jgi:hypothetical protein
MNLSTLSETQKRLLLFGGLILLLVLAVLRTNYGLWNADIPLGDESGYVEKSYELFEKGALSNNIYFDSYIAAFKWVSRDPIVAHYCVRFLASLFSVVGLFLLLSTLSWVSPLGAFVMALLWNLNLLATPLIQFANVNLFCFAVASWAGYLWIGNRWGCSRFLSLAMLLALVNVRPEYALLPCLLVLWKGVLWTLRARDEGWPRRRVLQLGSLPALLLIVAGTVLATPGLRASAAQRLSYLDKYLFFGLSQCYTAFCVARDPGLHLEPMTEYNALAGKQFPGADGFVAALGVNPGEIGRYFALNFLSNLKHLHYLLPTQSVLLPTGLANHGMAGLAEMKKLAGYPLLWIEQIAICLMVAFGGLWLAVREAVRLRLRSLREMDDLFFILGLAAVSSVSMLVLIPDPRYWITMIPLLFWGPAAFISRYLVPSGRAARLALAAALSFVFVNPVFTSALNQIPHKDKDLVLALREKIPAPGKVPVKALGVYPEPLLSFAIPAHWQSMDNMDVRQGNTTYEAAVRSGENDLVIVDGWLMRTDQYKKEERFFTGFASDPGAYGYQLLLASARQDGPVAVYRRRNPR